MRNEIRYVIGAAIGALLALMVGLPSLGADDDTESPPPLFSVYCDYERSMWEGQCVPSGAGITLMLLVGAGVGALGAAVLNRRKPTQDAGAGDSSAQTQPSDPSAAIRAALVEARSRATAIARAAGDKRSAQAQPSDPSAVTRAALVEARSRTAAIVHATDDSRSSVDDVISEAALDISAAVERKRDSVVQSILRAEDPGSASEETIKRRETIQRKFAATHISDDLSERATRLGIVNLAGTAVERALEMGWLSSHGTGPDQLLFRTSIPLEASTTLEAMSDSKESAAALDIAESIQEDTEEPTEDSDTSTGETPAATRQPWSWRGIASFSEIEEARSRAAAAGHTASERRSAPAQHSAPSEVTRAAIVEAQSRAAAATRTADERRNSRDDVILEAALDISAAVERKRDSTVQSILTAEDLGSLSEEAVKHRETIRRKSATTHISDDLRERATRLGIVNLAGTAVERALEMGWLTSHGTGPDQLLSRTSIPLEASTTLGATSDSTESAAASDRAESIQEDTEEPTEDSDTGTGEAPATKRTESESLEELESLIRLHERGVLTDAELQAAKSRLLNQNNR